MSLLESMIHDYHKHMYIVVWDNPVAGEGGKHWQIGNFKNLAGKTLANCNESSLSSSIKTCHSHATLNLKLRSFTLSSRVVLKWCGRL